MGPFWAPFLPPSQLRVMWAHYSYAMAQRTFLLTYSTYVTYLHNSLADSYASASLLTEFGSYNQHRPKIMEVIWVARHVQCPCLNPVQNRAYTGSNWSSSTSWSSCSSKSSRSYCSSRSFCNLCSSEMSFWFWIRPPGFESWVEANILWGFDHCTGLTPEPSSLLGTRAAEHKGCNWSMQIDW